MTDTEITQADRIRRTMTDPQRMLWRDDVEGICSSIEMCFEYGGHVRCGPCAIKQATQAGCESDLSVPNLPEVYRLLRESKAVRTQARNEALAEAAKEIVAYCREMNAAGKEASFVDVHRRVRALTASQGGEEGQGHSAAQNDVSALRGVFPGDLEGIADGT